LNAVSPSKSNTSNNATDRAHTGIDMTPVPAKINQAFMGQESIVPESDGNSQLLQNVKTRFTSAYSAVAWPRRLGTSIGLVNPPRMQAFAWNTGTRAEQSYAPSNALWNIISLKEMTKYTDIYFQEVHPFFGLLDAEWFKARTNEIWTTRRQGTDFEACMCMVFALGSYFSGTVATPSSFETQVVEQGRLLLDVSFAYPPAMVSLKHVAAWTLRAIYLRLVTRPHLSWMASCNAIHIAESIGLHREITDIQVPRSVTPLEIELRRRTFWVTMALHQYFASEYGRSRIILDSVACQPITRWPDDLTTETMALLMSVPSQDCLGRSTELLEALSKAAALSANSPFLALLRTDACFCIYRMLCSTNSQLPVEQIPSLLEVIRTALDGVAFLGSINHPWWNAVGTPFHSVCVLISLGTTESFELVPLVLETLKNITTTFNSHLSNEALRTAYDLVKGARDKRKQGLESLDRGLSLIGEPSILPQSTSDPLLNEFEWPAGNLEFQDCLDLTTYFGLDPLL
jgi:hypothetical protein